MRDFERGVFILVSLGGEDGFEQVIIVCLSGGIAAFRGGLSDEIFAFFDLGS